MDTAGWTVYSKLYRHIYHITSNNKIKTKVIENVSGRGIIGWDHAGL